ncbi:hypothetical protein ABH923_001924 [Leifsonia sp. EB41]
MTIERLPGPDDDAAPDIGATEDYALIDFDEGL